MIRMLCALSIVTPSAIAFAATPSEPPLPPAASRSYLDVYKDAALAECIATAYKDQPAAAADARASAGGLDNWSDYDAEASTGEIPRLIARYLARPYASSQGPGVKLDLMKCIDLYHSADLAKLARRYVPHPARSYRQDQRKP